MTVSMGITIPQRGALIGVGSLGDLLELAPRAEETGLFESAWVGDSLTAKPRPESIGLLGAMAAMTDRLRLGVGCMASFPVRDPAVFAYQWATLDQVSGGRMELAACTGIVSADGASRREGRNFGGVVDIDRAARLEEHMEVCRRLWAGETLTFDGRFNQYEDLTIIPGPVQDPCPIWIAANPAPGRFWERSLTRVATLADGFQTCHLAPGVLGAYAADVLRLRAEAGLATDNFPVMAYHNVNIGPDRHECLAESKRFLDAYYGPVFTEPMVEAWTAAGSPEQCLADLHDLVQQGATAITLRCTSFDQDGQFRRLCDEVLPELVGGGGPSGP
ncbi:MAG: LLM class flavin-dependent oxidoreductase [Actinomycetia bacterium]|nr:LLM class flavin-dependent oxidoreductase [Actinomycetes bacterium]MCP3910298.1 LLM class flavin-dependent oxidoreductase [Actinomycetes bacterium]MCP4087003.1 LLM class flavin-dependent oxidoreductase [Actinomycetes bacterium]